ncbi:MAG: hypothetical protein M1839_008232 [Geoglossum umbratile]|nr:MAG: hypothetical protein M1839_008232 [Geoglossum umbratile]
MDQNNSRRQGDFYSHAAKRRRVEAASHTLSKPFRSPFKATTKPQDVRECSALAGPPATSDEKRPVGLAHTHERTPSSSSPSRTAKSRWSRATFSNEPILNLLLKEERGLERELRELRMELDTVEQARKIEMKEEDEELAGLIEKWKGAARAAAEEVFRKVSDRVNRMGGPAAWKEMQKKKNEWSGEGFGIGEARTKDSDGDGDDDERRDRCREYDAEIEELKDVGEEASDEDGFTMGMMLRSLNIELDIIGYDKQAQRWME